MCALLVCVFPAGFSLLDHFWIYCCSCMLVGCWSAVGKCELRNSSGKYLMMDISSLLGESTAGIVHYRMLREALPYFLFGYFSSAIRSMPSRVFYILTCKSGFVLEVTGTISMAEYFFGDFFFILCCTFTRCINYKRAFNQCGTYCYDNYKTNRKWFIILIITCI